MKKQLQRFAIGILTSILLTGCGQNAEIAEFKYEIDAFCTSISEIDSSINNIDATAENATTELLGYLDDLEEEFQKLAELDFPAEFDYLEEIADEAGSYMTEAVESYHKAYSEGYHEELAAYAKENYSRAYKRIQIIITLLHGEEPENIDLSTKSEE